MPGAAVLVTRPEPGAAETAARLTARGLAPILAPMLVVARRTISNPGRPQAILVTSANAIPGLPATLHATPLLAVGDATAARARDAGFTDIASAGRDAAALATLVQQRCTPSQGALLLACGAGQGGDLVADLRRRGFTVRRRVAYTAAAARALPPPAEAALAAGEVAIAMFFSPATARAFVACLSPRAHLARPVEAIAISPACARPLAALPFRAIRIAPHPDQDSMLGLLP